MHAIRWMPALAGVCLVSTPVRAQFADSVVAYNPGTGYANNFTNASAALGAPALGASVTPFAPPFSNSQIVSIGAGGSLTLHLSEPIPDTLGVDFMIFGNSFFVSSGGNVSGLFTTSVSTEVEVSADDVTWYTLNPSLAPTVSSLYPTDGAGNPTVPVNPSLSLTNFTGLSLADVRALYDGSAGGADYDLAWAEDSNGDSVDLPDANYVRIDVLSGRTQVDALSVVPEPGTVRQWVLSAVLCAAGMILRGRRMQHG